MGFGEDPGRAAVAGFDGDVMRDIGGPQGAVGPHRTPPIGGSVPADQSVEDRVIDITAWWIGLAKEDAATTAPKAIEYGASDLDIMGKAMEGLFAAVRRARGLPALDSSSLAAIGREMAVAFYALGKAARLFGAYERGELPGEDSWFDLTVYSMMARRIRATERWV